MNAWSHLPNAERIDLVLRITRGAARVASRDAARVAAWDAARVAAWVAARDAARVAAWDAAWDAARVAARDAARDAAWVAVWVAARVAARDAARDAIAALVAWDDAGGLLGMPADALKLLAASGHAPAVLLLPFCTLFEKELGL